MIIDTTLDNTYFEYFYEQTFLTELNWDDVRCMKIVVQQLQG